MYEEYREKVEASLSSADYYDYYTSTTDLWSSRTTEPYLSLTVHYINSDWDSDWLNWNLTAQYIYFLVFTEYFKANCYVYPDK